MNSKNTFPEVLWAGTEHSLALAMEAHDRMMAGAFSDDDEEDDDDEVPFNYSVQGDVGIIAIKGSLTNRDVWYNRYLGVTSYADIRKALMYAASSGVKAIVLDIDSGGGAVSGVADAGNLIKLIDQSVKPVYSFTDGAMCSAAYWLGCSAREVYSSNVSTVGSIGVIATHMEYSKALKEAGVGVTVVRAGEYKALANSRRTAVRQGEDATPEPTQRPIRCSSSTSPTVVNTTVNLCDANMAQGREFFGKEALAAGLVDGIETFDSMMSKVEMKLLDIEKHSNNNLGNYQRGIDMGKKALTETDIAALAAGVDLDAAADPVVEGNESTTEPTLLSNRGLLSNDGGSDGNGRCEARVQRFGGFLPASAGEGEGYRDSQPQYRGEGFQGQGCLHRGNAQRPDRRRSEGRGRNEGSDGRFQRRPFRAVGSGTPG
jgi:signal peptide peptidase SppA